MFRKQPTEPTVIGQGAVIEGSLRVSGRVQIDGRVEGSLIVEGMVSVGPTGSISGEVTADELAVGGRVEGKVNARKHLYVAASGAVCGELHYGTLQVERGAVLDGRALHGDQDGAPASDGQKRASLPQSAEQKKLSPPMPSGAESKPGAKPIIPAPAS